ncbi:uncharacterized protein B0H18DRAFT_1214568, partial [Fomitopsis serialis]|uniref:uncharacterized protein n=1 Tax=Fomitopsis serialis TaxID=139415 RepID=UPI002007829D
MVYSLSQITNWLPEDATVRLQNINTGEIVQVPGPIPRSVMFFSQLSKLFLYSFLIHIDDVPADILDNVIWALEMFVDLLTECTDALLGAIFPRPSSAEDNAGLVHASPRPIVSQSGNILIPDYSGRLFKRQQAKAKLTLFLLKPEVNRPKDATKYWREIIDHQHHFIALGQPVDTQHGFLMIFAEALARSGEDDATAE